MPMRTLTTPSSGHSCVARARWAATAAATAAPALRNTKKNASPWRSISDSAVLAEGVAEQDVVLREDRGVTLAPELLQEPRRPLDVREEKS